MFTLTRRGLAAALVSLALISPVMAQDWQTEFPELTIGIASGENESDAIARTQPYADYLSKELGVPVKIVRGTDYAAVIEAMRSGHVQFASVGPAAYALARKVMGEDIAPVAVTLDQDGNLGYYSVIAVRADSPPRPWKTSKASPLLLPIPTRPPAMPCPPITWRPNSIPRLTSISAMSPSLAAMSRASWLWSTARSKPSPPIGATRPPAISRPWKRRA